MTEHRPYLELAAAALDFELSGTEREALAAHLATCAACGRRAAAMRADARVISTLPMRALPVGRSPVILSAALRPRPSISPLRLVALIALLALVGFALVTVGSELVRRMDTRIVDLPNHSPRATALLPWQQSTAWVAAAPLGVARTGHSATLLPDGRVLVAGGRDAGALHSSELYDPGTGLWSPAPDMQDARWGHAAIAHFDEEVIFFGGYGLDGSAIAGIESYAGDAWVPGPFLIEARAEFAVSAPLAPRGVMIIGGYGADGRALASVEILDLDLTGEVLPAAPLAVARARLTATRLFNGRIVVAGGVGDDGQPIAEAELWDPTTRLWTTIAPMHEARVGHTAIALNDDRVLVAGGRGPSGETLATSELYDPATDTWTVVLMGEAREGHAATKFAGSTVLIVGGSRDGVFLSSTEIFDPIAETWTAGPSLLQARSTVVVRLKDGSAMVVGGTSSEAAALDDVEIFNPLATP